MDELRIPKIAVPIVAHTDQNEIIGGEIFLERIHPEGYSTGQVADFFNSAEPFFPLRTETSVNPLLIRKQSLVWIEFPELYERYEKEVLSSLDNRKNSILHVKGFEPIQAQVIVSMPEDHLRILDFLNARGIFVPVIMGQTFALFNSRAIDRVEEP